MKKQSVSKDKLGSNRNHSSDSRSHRKGEINICP